VVDIEIKTMPDRPDLTAAPELVVDAVLAAVASAGMAGQVVLRSFDWRALHHARRVAPAIPRGYLTSPATTADAVLWWGGVDPARFGGSVPATIAAISAASGTIWAPAHASLSHAQVREAQALGLVVMPWTVNAAADMARLIGWGVRAICTDYPDRLKAIAG
jgi:glycerophosphoryl diester phosphodiesterase